MSNTQKALHIPSGRGVVVYKHRERPTYVDTIDYNTEYPKEEIKLY